MKVFTKEITKSTKGNCDIINITADVSAIVRESSVKEGNCTVFSVGSTASLTTIEYEPGLLKDLPKFFEKIIPSAARYHHDDTWGDSNGYAHIRSSLLKTDLSVPLINGELILGTWQQIVLIDFDNRKRTRRIVVQVMGI